MSGETTNIVPPYASATSFRNYIEHLREKQPLPTRIDKSMMAHLNYGTQQALMVTLRLLGLVSKEDAPTPRLEKLVSTAEKDRAPLYMEMLRECYPFMFDGSIDLTRASANEFQERLRGATGVQGSTAEKVSSFFLALAEDAGAKLSPHLKRKPAVGNGKRAKPKGRRVKAAEPAADLTEGQTTQQRPTPTDMTNQLLSKFPTFDPAWPDEIKSKWFAGFERLMKSAERSGDKK